MDEREKLIESAAAAMAAAGRIPERQILAVLPDDVLREITDYYSAPVVAV